MNPHDVLMQRLHPFNIVGMPSSSVTSEEEDPTGSEAVAAAGRSIVTARLAAGTSVMRAFLEPAVAVVALLPLRSNVTLGGSVGGGGWERSESGYFT